MILKHGSKEIGTLKILDMCYLTYPCSHVVQDLITGEIKQLSGREIYNLLKKQNISDKHFDIYNDIDFNKRQQDMSRFFKHKQLTEE